MTDEQKKKRGLAAEILIGKSDEQKKKDAVLINSLKRLENLTGEDFHGYRSEVWRVVADVWQSARSQHAEEMKKTIDLLERQSAHLGAVDGLMEADDWREWMADKKELQLRLSAFMSKQKD